MSGVVQGEELVRVGSGDPDYHAAVDFLHQEAELLDARRWRDWLALLAEDVTYEMPVRVTRARTLEDSTLADMDHFREDRFALQKRVERLETEYAWTEDPPSRTRHFVTNVQVFRAASGDLVVKSYLLLFRSRGDTRPPEWVCGERTDRLRRTPEGLRLVHRRLVVDESVLRTQNLAIFL
ncbi:MAG: 3-phenylpropionate/cinnamic acid dioxygenase subunit beta [Armatimonadota bacterium]|nr:3-phenylpropionate/cinnamic acid dioxygenase subunit beta [Armatimonadota bacterium]MDR5689828.1 3-phenylpropionate/cinnamic acid dioxygenase subunit beta [Armatimonadota bacterium]MDR7387995.1 3-phenylpropionate/cinnamic acid dioxygenase subunit beta [Armatimonadota bacterium]MDR7389140.1 3-phenylpropionate/cinnamic acid dioxygenase subunit beta [Armatimonadota bacterium]MDR7391168.1 3-phenylpropionate/cinnamic acid dioxygenase subunit beta [Armatimonadota bacterium]